MGVTPIIWFSIIGISAIIVMIPYYIISFLNKPKNRKQVEVEPFVISAYYDRTEKESLKILEEYKPVGKTIILWWGFDGLQMNEDGSSEWISRKKSEPINQSVFYQPVQSLTQAAYPSYAGYQNTQAMIDALQTQIAMQNINAQMQAQLQHYQVSYPRYCAPYFYSGTMGCCCNSMIQR